MQDENLAGDISAAPHAARPWSPDRMDLRRILAAILLDEISKLRRKSLPPDMADGWDDSTRIDEDGLGLDSLALLGVCSRVSQYFHLHEVGIEDYLFVRRTFGEWIEIVATSIAIRSERLTFQTSGGSGAPKPCTHEIAALLAEVEDHARRFSGCQRVLAFTPCHHIYGFLFSVALPRLLERPVADARAWSPGKLSQALQPGDLLIATPFLWRLLLTALGSFPPGVTGVSSTAPLPDDLRTDLETAGLDRLVEIYGSSETAGVGVRDTGESHFRLLPFWRLEPATGELARMVGGAEIRLAPQDHLVFADSARFLPRGRRDGAVQIGGVNVFPAHVAEVVRRHPAVLDCAIRCDGDASSQRLKAFVALRSEGIGEDAVAKDLEQWMREQLSASERPVSVAYGAALPRDGMGKQIDW
jgi:4-coumarate--CoA ligase (photoactive yellow protein activation family)